MLSYLVTIPPGELNTNTLAQNLQVANQTVFHYLTILQDVNLIRLVYPNVTGNQQLRKPQKVFLHNTNLYHALQQYVAMNSDNKGTVRELYFLQAMQDAENQVFFAKPGDFCTKEKVFEIGGKNKTFRQIKNSSLQQILVKDDIITPMKNIIPLLYFGFLY